MAEEYKKKEGIVDGLSAEDITIVMQVVLYEDCKMVRQHRQLLEDEEYAKGLQETFDAELAHGTANLSVTESGDAYNTYYESDSRTTTIPFEPRGTCSSCSRYSNSFTFSSTSCAHTTTDSDDDLPGYAENEEHASQGSSSDDDVLTDVAGSSYYYLPSSDFIDLLPTRSYSSQDVHDIISDNKACLICLVNWKTGDCLKSLPCFHEFHTDCIDQWLMIKESCPICRHDITHEDQ